MIKPTDLKEITKKVRERRDVELEKDIDANVIHAVNRIDEKLENQAKCGAYKYYASSSLIIDDGMEQKWDRINYYTRLCDKLIEHYKSRGFNAFLDNIGIVIDWECAEEDGVQMDVYSDLGDDEETEQESQDITLEQDDNYYAEKIKKCDYYDQEQSHLIADELLCEILNKVGYGRTVDAFNQLSKWYS